jgi:oligopeptide transport system substrate-binding protein
MSLRQDLRCRTSLSTRRAGFGAAYASLILLATAACSEPAERGYSKPITLGITPAVSAPIPTAATDPTARYLVSNLFTGLTTFTGSNGRPGRGVASKIETADQTTWTVTLAKGWTFHDETPVTAASFVDAWNYAANPANGAANQAAFGNIAGFAEVATPGSGVTTMSGLQVVDDQTFTITLASPDSQLQTALATPAFAPLPQVFFDNPQEFADNPVGNGPFSWVSGSDGGAELERYPNYRARSPLVTAVTLRPFDDPAQSAGALETGAIDIYVEQTTEATTEVSSETPSESESGVVVTQAPSGSLQFLAFPLYDPRFASPDVRAALSRAIDKNQILAQLPEFGVEAANSWAAPVANGYSAAGCGANCTYNAEKALNELESGGGFDGPLAISYPAGSEAATWLDGVCTSISNTLAIECSGQELAPEAFDAAVASRTMPGPFVQEVGVPEVPSLEDYLGASYLPFGPENVTGFTNDEFNFTLATGLTQPQADGLKTIQSAQKVLGSEMPSVPLWFPMAVAHHTTEVRNVALTPLSQVDLMKVSVG